MLKEEYKDWIDTVSNVNSNPKSVLLAVAFLNLIYVALTVMMTFPGMFRAENGSSYTSGYGATVVIYSIGLLYGFFCDILIPSNNVAEERKKIFAIFSLLKGIFSAIICCLVVAYYFVANAEWLIWTSYGCTLIPAVLVICEVALLGIDHMKAL